ncbi:hypothetical protein F5050DRAFT_740915 [Lentinula boryana]|uniref:Uncharacterized protein n=1 Tax=Lentinula boryana TaxID=40481 RepID=A0ABQ8Q407_9AGAR|nr:hypothetical protein F5050DRAFT_740915 [Lentinula boryana]
MIITRHSSTLNKKHCSFEPLSPILTSPPRWNIGDRRQRPMPNYSDSENEIIDRIARNPHPQRLPRNDDSSSSRESSPDSLRKQNRSFTPASDDGDFQTSTIPEGYTPLPPEKPVIRQALGFASALGGIPTSSTVNTYQAKPNNPEKVKFLPGQTVVPAKKSKASSTKTKKAKKKDYAAQTGRFRVSDWASSSNNASAPEAPPAPAPSPIQLHPAAVSDVNSMLSGAGMPYLLPTTQTPQIDPMYSVPPPPSVSNNITPYFSNTQYMPTTSTHSPAPITPAAKFPLSDSQIELPKVKAPDKSKDTPSKNISKTKQKNKPAANSSKRPTVHSNENVSRSTTYYRQDYDNQVDLDAISTPGAGPSSDILGPSHLVSQGKQGHLSIKHSKPSRPASRMVTVLITDIRSGQEDHQLTEVIVPLKDTDPEHPEYGFWANAQEVVGKLQSSPSRVEGPARAYTMRGKYRQIFMRQQEDGTFEAKPVNIGVSSERILEIVVEKLPAPDELSSTSFSHDSQDNTRERKRYRSPSDGGDRLAVDYDRFSSDHRSRSGSISYQRKKRARVDEEETQDSDFIPLTGTCRHSDCESPTSDDGESLDARIVERIIHALQMHSTNGLWESIFKTKARLPRVSAYIEMCRILQLVLERYEGKVPFKRNHNVRIQKVHILKALCLLDEEDEHSDLSNPGEIFANCVETVRLLSLYGPQGTRSQDAGVQEMIDDDSPPEKYTKPQQRLLELLREIDEKWQKDHVERAKTDALREQWDQAEAVEREVSRSSAQTSPEVLSTDGTVSTVVERGSSATLASN